MIRILTDSTADFSMADAAALGVAVVPLTVSFGDAHYQDGIDLPLERFYDMLAAADKLPTTSQPSPELFLSHFLAAKAAGDTVISPAPAKALRSPKKKQNMTTSISSTAAAPHWGFSFWCGVPFSVLPRAFPPWTS